MSKKLYEENDIQNIADAIREKNGSSDTYKVSDMATAVSEIPTGGGGEKMFTGHADVEGLKSIGWADEDIAYFQEHGVCWDEEYDDNFKVDSSNSSLANNNIMFLPKGHNLTTFYGKSSLIGLVDVNYNADITFYNCYVLSYIPEGTYTGKNTCDSLFNNCAGLLSVKNINLPNSISSSGLFYYCRGIHTIENINIPKTTNCSSMFYYCSALVKIKNCDFGKPTRCDGMFYGCQILKTIPNINFSNCTMTNNMFYGCTAIPMIGDLNLNKVTDTRSMFYNCLSLHTIGDIQLDSAESISNMFASCTNLENLGRLNNLGKAYKTSSAANYSNYSLYLNSSNKLTHDSLMNIINSLYDIASNGVQPQKLVLGSTNLAKLTDEEVAIATAKGWTVS